MRLQQAEDRELSISDDDAMLVSDWMHALAADGDRLTKSRAHLNRMTWDQAMIAQQKWHSAIAKRSARMNKFGGAPDDVVTVLELADGYRWVRVTSPEGLDFEGNAMGHCVGSGNYDSDVAILSLRDKDNLPHCTVEWNEAANSFQQVQGRANQQVVEKYHPMVVALVQFIQPVDVRGASKFGHGFIGVNGKPKRLMRWDELEPGDSVDGEMDLRGCTALTHLPDGLTVGGHLYLACCTALTHLPDGLSVSGYLYLGGCTGLTHLPDGLSVGKSLSLNACTGLTHLPDGLSVGGGLRLDGCTGLTHLPDGLSVGGWLDLSGCTGLTHLPDGLSLGGGLRLDGCTGLTHLPDDISVTGIVLSDDQVIESIDSAREWFLLNRAPKGITYAA